ncbi:MAG: 1,3-beta-galactosyl-N-acetylhexosamine phosphorylase N-terminal domain-containing protein [Coprococcus sp.]
MRQEVGYKFRPEFIIDQGYMNNMYRIPSKEFMDFQRIPEKRSYETCKRVCGYRA